MKKAFFSLCFILMPTSAFSAEPATYGSAIMQMIWALLIVLGIILLLYAIAKKRLGIGGAQTGEIKVKEIRYLMPKKGLAIVEVRGQEMLIGVGVNNLELLTLLPKTQETSLDFDEVLEKNIVSK